VRIIKQLPCSLRALSLAGRALDAEAAKGVAQLTALQALEWTDSPVTAAGLQQLTALQRLTRLELARCPELPKRFCPVWDGSSSYMGDSMKRVFKAASDVSMCRSCTQLRLFDF
jgi:hypothetical protein